MESRFIPECNEHKVRLVDGRVVTLKNDPNLGDKNIDTDGYGKPDLEELTEKRIVKSMGQEIEVWDFDSDPTVSDNNDLIKYSRNADNDSEGKQ